MKHFFAFFMLFVYGLSFAHDFIPHHTHDLQDVHEHHSDTHNHDDNSSHNHIQHDNHVDEGLLDYLSCVLADHEHNPAQECSYSETITNQKNNSQQQLKRFYLP